MYQRYYKQKKFGRIFSFVLVIGSGITHFIKSNITQVKNIFRYDNLIKYDEFLPNYTKEFLNNYIQIRDGKLSQIKELIKKNTKEESELEKFKKDNKWIFREIPIEEKKFNIETTRLKSKEEAKFIETYIIIKKIKTKL